MGERKDPLTILPKTPKVRKERQLTQRTTRLKNRLEHFPMVLLQPEQHLVMRWSSFSARTRECGCERVG